ncbi:MAG TPA: DinB family protein [Chitinophagaceae bacterium]|jgi:hypothetical protein|nr:DinB family protein [Chitinophagaceae bacterium]
MASAQFNIIRQNREAFIRLLDGLTIEQLNEVPAGFNNNIAWNFGHMIVAQQTIAYLRSGQKLLIDTTYVDRYKRGTKPESFISAEEINFLKEKAIEFIDQYEKDWNAGVFKNFEPFTSSLGVHVSTNEEALHSVTGHDQLHFGYAMAQRKLILSKSFIHP